MSLLIKGMEMPKSCIDCKISVYDEEYGTICPFSGIACLNIGRQDDCPLIEIPSYGRLIDANALKEKFPKPQDWMSIAQALIHITGIWAEIDNAPTIIEAEEDE